MRKMRKMRKNEDLYFYKGKFYTELGLKRVLSKDGHLTYSRGTFYFYEKVSEYFVNRTYLKDCLTDEMIITPEESKHFQKWLNNKVKNGEIRVLRNYTFYHRENIEGNIGGDWNEALEDLMDNLDIRTDEQVIEDYCQTLDKKEFYEFLKLSDLKQFNIASKWAIETYNKKQGA